MRFAMPWALALLVLAPLVLGLHFYLEQQRSRILAAAGDPRLLERLVRAQAGPSRRRWQTALLALGLALLAVALARPQFGMKTEVRKGRGMDVVIALDLSRSMLAADVIPSRLERARAELNALIEQLPGDRIGLVGFTSVALPLCPLTVDHTALALQLRNANPGDLPRGGTAIGEALNAARNMLESSKIAGAAKAIVVVTDGEEHEGDPEKVAAEAHQAGIEVHVVGVGSKSGEPIPLVENGQLKGYLKDERGQIVVSRLDEARLSALASAGGGKVALPSLQGGFDLGPVRDRLASLKKGELEDRVVRIYEERYHWFLVPAFLLLFLSALARPTRLALALLIPLQIAATPFEADDPDVRAGNTALSAGKAKEAVEAYQRAEARLGKDPRLAYNQGLAQAAAGELDRAKELFARAAEGGADPSLRGRAAFALGNTHRQLNQWDDAIGAYKRALLDDPDLSGARRNLEIAQRQKIIAAAQPKPPPQNDGDQPPPPQDGGSGDSGSNDGGSNDSSTNDGSSNDGSSNEDGGVGDGSASGGADSGSGQEDAGAADGSSGQGQDGGTANQDASTGPQPQSPQEQDLAEQNAEELLDALQDQEKAVKRRALEKKLRGRGVAKDW